MWRIHSTADLTELLGHLNQKKHWKRAQSHSRHIMTTNTSSSNLCPGRRRGHVHWKWSESSLPLDHNVPFLNCDCFQIDAWVKDWIKAQRRMPSRCKKGTKYVKAHKNSVDKPSKKIPRLLWWLSFKEEEKSRFNPRLSRCQCPNPPTDECAYVALGEYCFPQRAVFCPEPSTRHAGNRLLHKACAREILLESVRGDGQALPFFEVSQGRSRGDDPSRWSLLLTGL